MKFRLGPRMLCSGILWGMVIAGLIFVDFTELWVILLTGIVVCYCHILKIKEFREDWYHE